MFTNWTLTVGPHPVGIWAEASTLIYWWHLATVTCSKVHLMLLCCSGPQVEYQQIQNCVCYSNISELCFLHAHFSQYIHSLSYPFWHFTHTHIYKGATPPAADPWSRGLERKKKGLVVTCSCVGNVCVYFSSDPAMSEADLHVLSGALAFGGTETLGAGAFRGISRSALEVAGLEREEENNSSSSNNKKNNNNKNHKPKRKPNPKLQQEEKDQQQEQQTTATRKRRGATTTRARTRTRTRTTTATTTTTTTTRTTTTTTTASTSTSTPTTTTRRRKTTFSQTRSPCRWLGSADIYIYILTIESPFYLLKMVIFLLLSS